MGRPPACRSSGLRTAFEHGKTLPGTLRTCEHDGHSDRRGPGGLDGANQRRAERFEEGVLSRNARRRSNIMFSMSSRARFVAVAVLTALPFGPAGFISLGTSANGARGFAVASPLVLTMAKEASPLLRAHVRSAPVNGMGTTDDAHGGFGAPDSSCNRGRPLDLAPDANYQAGRVVLSAIGRNGATFIATLRIRAEPPY